MAMAVCPECGARVSERATVCPRCGYSEAGEAGLVPFGSMEAAPTCLEIKGLALVDCDVDLVPRGPRKRLAEFLRDAGKMHEFAPALFNAIEEIRTRGQTVWAADFSAASQKLMESGELVLGIDRETGDFLPQLRDAKTGRIYELARLKARELPNGVASSLATLQLQASMTEVANQIKELAASIERLRLEIRGDRMGRVKAVWEELRQAAGIQDARLRERRLLDIARSATEQRCILQENFGVQLGAMDSSGGPFQNKARGDAAREALVDLYYVALMSRAECVAYCALDEQDAARRAIDGLGSFIGKYGLDDRQVLLRIGSASSENLQEVIDGFHGLARNVSRLALGAPGVPAALPEPSDGDNNTED